MLLLALLAASLAQLGSPDWQTRHDATEALTFTDRGKLMSRLFTEHHDPEVRLRLWILGREKALPLPMAMPAERFP